MRSGTVTLALLGLVLFWFGAYFLGLRTMFSSEIAMESRLAGIVQYAERNQWEQAEEAFNRLMEAWNKEKFYLALNYAEADYSILIDNLARTRAAIELKDAAETVSQVRAVLVLWRNFTKVIPEP